MISIIDVIDHRNRYFTQRMLVVDQMPQFTYERKGSLLIGDDSGFFRFYGYEACSERWKAFAGAKFSIPMKDGSTIEAHGQWWDVMPSDFFELTYNLGVNTTEGLSHCHVFSGGIHVDRELVDSWLMTNDPSNNYQKYDPRNDNYGKHTIVSRWEDSVSNEPGVSVPN